VRRRSDALSAILKLQRSQVRPSASSSKSAKKLGVTHLTPIHVVIGSYYRQSAIDFASKKHELDDTASASQKKRAKTSVVRDA